MTWVDMIKKEKLIYAIVASRRFGAVTPPFRSSSRKYAFDYAHAAHMLFEMLQSTGL